MASCSDCAGPCEVGASDLASLRADLAAGARKVLRGGCLPGGPVVVTICKAMPAVDLEQAVEALAAAADDADEEPVKPVTFKVACEIEGLPVRSTSHHERDTVVSLLLARGWKREPKVEGERRFWWWYQPAPHERATW